MSSKADLGLIKVFLAIYDSGSVSGAAERLNLTQPSVSYALGRLRDLLHDPLFTRTRDGMQPTFVADQYYATFRESIVAIEQVISSAQRFDPSHSTRIFRIALSDVGEYHLLPFILKAFQQSAPSCNLEVMTVEIDKLEEWLQRGRVDAALGNYSDLSGDLEFRVIFTEKYACVLSSQHPRITDRLGKKQFFSEKHVLISNVSGHFLVGEFLKHQQTIRIALKTPHFSTLPGIIPGSEMIACVPSRIAKQFAQTGAMKAYPLPVNIPSFDVGLYWNANTEDIAAQNWFRDLIYCSLKSI